MTEEIPHRYMAKIIGPDEEIIHTFKGDDWKRLKGKCFDYYLSEKEDKRATLLFYLFKYYTDFKEYLFEDEFYFENKACSKPNLI